MVTKTAQPYIQLQFASAENHKTFNEAKYRMNKLYTPYGKRIQIRSDPTGIQSSIYNKAISFAQDLRSRNMAAMAVEDRIRIGMRPNTPGINMMMSVSSKWLND